MRINSPKNPGEGPLEMMMGRNKLTQTLVKEKCLDNIQQNLTFKQNCKIKASKSKIGKGTN